MFICPVSSFWLLPSIVSVAGCWKSGATAGTGRMAGQRFDAWLHFEALAEAREPMRPSLDHVGEPVELRLDRALPELARPEIDCGPAIAPQARDLDPVMQPDFAAGSACGPAIAVGEGAADAAAEPHRDAARGELGIDGGLPPAAFAGIADLRGLERKRPRTPPRSKDK